MPIQTTFCARWVFPVDSPPLENGVVGIAEGRIVAVHDRFDPAAKDLGNVAIIPALVNCHTHLELSDVPEPLAPSLPFANWIRRVVAHRRSRSISMAQAVELGRRECTRSGSAWVGDIVQEPSVESRESREIGPNFVAFRELIGLQQDQVAAQVQVAREALLSADSRPSSLDSRLLRGLSPHAPYSVHPDLIRAAVNLAIEFDAPLTIHLAETRAELELLRDGSGEFVEMLQQFGVWTPDAIPRGSRPLDYLRPLAAVPHPLVIHGNYLDREELNFLAAHQNIHVVYCPRTHDFFQHETHPWREMISRGISVALGTDSRASNPDLSLWNELQFLHVRHPDFPLAALLRLGTHAGAAALGVDDITGSLASGKLADLAVMSLPNKSGTDPHALLFDPGNRVVSTMICGQRAEGSGR